MSKGYFSLVQYCPDFARQEAVNVGVVLLCPEQDFIQVRMATANHRVRDLFGDEADDYRNLNSMKRSLEERIRVEAENLKTLDALQTFVQTRANRIILTNPKPVRVGNPSDDLTALFDELVAEPKKANSMIARSLFFGKVHPAEAEEIAALVGQFGHSPKQRWWGGNPILLELRAVKSAFKRGCSGAWVINKALLRAVKKGQKWAVTQTKNKHFSTVAEGEGLDACTKAYREAKSKLVADGYTICKEYTAPDSPVTTPEALAPAPVVLREARKAKEQGRAAYAEGVKFYECPYSYASDSQKRRAWQAGWDAAYKDGWATVPTERKPKLHLPKTILYKDNQTYTLWVEQDSVCKTEFQTWAMFGLSKDFVGGRTSSTVATPFTVGAASDLNNTCIIYQNHLTQYTSGGWSLIPSYPQDRFDKAKEQGRAAYAEGAKFYECPYSYASDSQKRRAWQAGWDAAYASGAQAHYTRSHTNRDRLDDSETTPTKTVVKD